MLTTRDPTDIRANERETESASNQQNASRKVELEDMRWLMGHKQGRRFAMRLLDKAGVYRTSFTGNSETFFREGMRNVGLFVLSEVMEVAPENFAKMLEEHKA